MVMPGNKNKTAPDEKKVWLNGNDSHLSNVYRERDVLSLCAASEPCEARRMI